MIILLRLAFQNLAVFVPLVCYKLQFVDTAGVQAVIRIVIYEQHAVIFRMQVTAQTEINAHLARRAETDIVIGTAVAGVAYLQFQIAVSGTYRWHILQYDVTLFGNGSYRVFFTDIFCHIR